MKWHTSGSHRLKAYLRRSFGARKVKKAAADIVAYKSFPKSSRLRIIRKNTARTERSMSDIYHESTSADTAYAREMNSPLFRHYLRRNMPVRDQAYFTEQRKESARLQLTQVVEQQYFRNEANSIALQELHQQRRDEQPQESRISCDNIQLTDGRMSKTDWQCWREQRKRQTQQVYTTHKQPIPGRNPTDKEQEAPFRGLLTPTTSNTHYQSQPQPPTLRYFNNGVEVDVNGIPLLAASKHHSL